MLHVGQGTTVGGLTLFPVWHDHTSVGDRRYDTATTTLQVSEADGGPSVPRLLAANTGARPVLVLDGQLFEGGWQHRMATRSSLVAAGAREQLDVACVEQGRWGGSSVQSSRGRRASTYVRHGYDEPGGQGEVWQRVQALGADSATGSLATRLDAPDAHAERVLRRARPLLGQTGAVVGIGGQPLALEVFDHPQTLAEQWEAIVRAACLDAAGRPVLATPGRRARRLVERLERTRLTRAGQDLARARTTDLDVMSLQVARCRVHLRATYRRHPILVGA